MINSPPRAASLNGGQLPAPSHGAVRESGSAVPRCVADTGLSWELLSDLLGRQLMRQGPQSPEQLSLSLALDPQIVCQVAERMQQQGLVAMDYGVGILPRCELSERGHAWAMAALSRSSYCGPAPVTLEEYRELVLAHSLRRQPVRQQEMRAAFDGVVVSETLLDAFGRGLNSDRAMLVHGPAGSGKTYLAQRLVRAFSSPTLIPYAIAVGDAIIPLHDPALHEPYGSPCADPRFALCRRPGIICGAQLTPDMLALRFDPMTRSYHAPLQLKANNGILIIDDLGRHSAPVEDLLQRWIVPLETRRDWLTLDNGRSFDLPFDVVLVLITDLPAESLAGEVLRRHIGHRLPLGAIQPGDYAAIWQRFCEQRRLGFDPELARYAIEDLHAIDGVPLLPSHPAELLSLMLDQSRYAGDHAEFTPAMLKTAWASNFPGRARRAADLH